MARPLIFISYTLRDRAVTCSLLERIRLIVAPFGETYVDILDNASSDPQAHVIATLNRADSFIGLVSESFLSSKWVHLELRVAEQRRIPRTFISVHRLVTTLTKY